MATGIEKCSENDIYNADQKVNEVIAFLDNNFVSVKTMTQTEWDGLTDEQKSASGLVAIVG